MRYGFQVLLIPLECSIALIKSSKGRDGKMNKVESEDVINVEWDLEEPGGRA